MKEDQVSPVSSVSVSPFRAQSVRSRPEHSSSPASAHAEGPVQFGLRGLLGLTTGLAILFAMLRLLDVSTTHTIVAFGAASGAAAIGISLIHLFWSPDRWTRWR